MDEIIQDTKIRPNIIFILADDLGYGDVKFLNPESKIPTPNLDKLAGQGMTFTDAHSGSAVCSPTRYGILTGRYAWRSSLQAGVLWKWDPPLIEENRLTVPAYLKQHGYPSYIYRGIKSDIWEGGHRVPFIARWPHKIKAGSQNDEVICLTDFFATTAALFDDDLPGNAAEDSFNIFPALLGDEYEKPIREATVHHSITGAFSIRQGKWKLEICPGSGGWTLPPETAMLQNKPMIQLYDLSIDIKEQHNLYEMYPEVVYRLTNLLEKYVERGRSTPGPAQENDGDPDIWRPMAIRNERY